MDIFHHVGKPAIIGQKLQCHVINCTCNHVLTAVHRYHRQRCMFTATSSYTG